MVNVKSSNEYRQQVADFCRKMVSMMDEIERNEYEKAVKIWREERCGGNTKENGQ